MVKFKSILIIFSLVGLASVISVQAELPAEQQTKQQTEQQWVDITETVYSNPTDKVGWTKGKTDKIYRDKAGMMLKITTTSFGNFIIDLKTSQLFQLEKDGSKVEIKEKKLFQRDHGFSIVFRTDKMKIRLRMTEKPNGITNVDGIRGMQ